MAKNKKAKARFPSRDEILEYIEGSPGKITKRDIANAFHIKGQDRIRLKKILKEFVAQGALARDAGKSLRPAGTLPHVLVVEITGSDEYGDLMARPQTWEGAEAPPRIYITQYKKKKAAALASGDFALVRVSPEEDEGGPFYTARIIRTLKGAPSTFIGVFHKTRDGGEIRPADKKNRKVYAVSKSFANDAPDNSLVLAEAEKKGTRTYRPHAKVIENLGDLSQPKSVSLIAIHHHDIPFKFTGEVLRDAAAASAPSPKGRADLRGLAFITIDPADARDHDDAVMVSGDNDAKNPGGFIISVAIADVAHYVRPGSALDKEAERRGNSAYFPDRVVPMLPEALSADLCSLVKGKDRAVFVCHLKINKDGKKLSHRFERAVIKCAANLSYQEVQGELDAGKGPWFEVTKPLYDAYLALKVARDARGPLALEMPERKIILDDDGNVADVVIRKTLAMHKVIEEFMVATNVAAAETLVNKRVLCMFRIHEEPGAEKLDALRQFLTSLNLKLARGQVLKPELFNRLLDKVADAPNRDLVNLMVLRTQSQAAYSPDNIGHFGLALQKYAHFTSPIRRYADILVHRALITALGLGKDGLAQADIKQFRKIAEDISEAERRAMFAERESTDRYLALYLSDRVGDKFQARISGVTRFGLFASVMPTGADGFIPMASLSDDFYILDDRNKRLIGRRNGRIFKLGDIIDVRLVEAEKITGSLKLEVLGASSLPLNLLKPVQRKGYQKNRGRRGKRR